ncbi:hypothetical protein [Arthrobacter sp. ES3-54]|uniref:hypothetical protein n=1 Tax=Arthrobacter sp. ES3-54 TaxID=1502991 RepID=UPI002406601E|nr:hypothetical protein [Arthrobacter sp. ES3-54]
MSSLRGALGLGAILLLSISLISPAEAAPTTSSPTASSPRANVKVLPGLQPCVDQAVKQKLRQWVCNAEGLTINKDAAGRQVNTFVKKKSTDYTTAVTQPRTGIVTQADDYDSWCEFGTICNRKITNYIAETKGNAAYGDQRGAIGSYDAILRTSLNGRQAQWKATVIWDNGPRLTFSSTQVQCTEHTFIPLICGNHKLNNVSPTTTSPGFRVDYPLIYGNRLNNSNNYHGSFQTSFTPAGYPTYKAANLAAMTFNCSGTAICKFP